MLEVLNELEQAHPSPKIKNRWNNATILYFKTDADGGSFGVWDRSCLETVF